jgi:hypothetical protein
MKNNRGILRRARAAAAIAVCILISPASLAADPPKPVVRSWLLEGCPAAPVTDARAAIAGPLIGMGVDFVLDKIGSALEKAAEEDRNGRATAGTGASYLYLYKPAQAGNPNQNIAATPATALPQRCLIVALTESPPGQWCATESPFSKASQFCTDASKTLFKTDKHRPIPEPLTGTGLPAFYIEIALLDSNDRRAVLPQIQALYYPAGIHGRKFTNAKPRDVHVKASAASPGGDAALGTISVHLRGLTPGTSLLLRAGNTPPKALNALDPLWVALAAMPKEYPAPAAERYVFPINLTAEVREVGDPNVFLQVTAKLFASQKAELAEKLKTRLTPGSMEEAELAESVTEQNALAAYEALVAAAMKGEAEFKAACESTKLESVKLAEARQKFFETVAAQRKANATADSSKIPADKRIKFSRDFGANAGSAQTATTSAALCAP